MAQPSAGARRSRRERLYPLSARPAKPIPSIAQVDGSGTAANSKSLEPVVNTTLPFLRRNERNEETGVLRIVDVAEIRIELRSEHLADERARPVRARIERHDVGRRRIVVVGRAPDDGQSVARLVHRHLAAFDVPPPVGRVDSAIRIPAGITEFRRIRRHDVGLADLDLRCAGSDAGLCIVRAGRVHAAVIVDRDAVYDCCRRRRGRSRQDCRRRTYDAQKNLIHRLWSIVLSTPRWTTIICGIIESNLHQIDG